MAWAFVASRGTATEDLSDTSHSISPSAAIPVGAVAVFAAATDNETATDGESTLHSSVADTDGHTWSKLLEWTEGGGGADAGATVSLWITKVTAEIGTADSVTLTLASARTAKVLALAEFSVAAGKTFSEAGQGGGQGTSDTPSATISDLASAERLWLGAVGVESNVTVTEDADYTQIATASVGSGGGAITLSYGQRIATLTGDTYNPTLSASRDWAAILVALDEVDEGGGVTGTVGQAVETDTAQPVTAVRVHTVGQSAQMETAQPLGSAKSVTTGQAVDTVTAQTVAALRAHTIGQVTEADTAQPVTQPAGQTPIIGQAVSVSTAQPVGAAKTQAIGQSIDTVTAQTLVPVRAHQIGQASETLSALTLSALKTVTLGQVVESDSAQSVSVPAQPSGRHQDGAISASSQEGAVAVTGRQK